MSSLDETFEQMQQFNRSLEEFSDVLSSTLVELTRFHDEAMAAWDNDQSSMRYNASWQELSEALNLWSTQDAPAYREFIAEKLAILEEYMEAGQ
ncbi:hypothetical protein CFR73_09705 [Novacetimonas maltaceti]|uniref:DUF4298 domain-containing protein n=1 Tax=Novacetimonas maltaceti TaxID=1203393 RepID=A0A2S3W3Z1_9PROT|nr:hypothetical protein [Novacetimonas maltaceti]POF63581.1 hypothetical protein KMAL_07610 [Novacetimonas maltaceti]PYD59852.1 hypothetical protein CFR73_09705 [Novacetimonas maltaceti]